MAIDFNEKVWLKSGGQPMVCYESGQGMIVCKWQDVKGLPQHAIYSESNLTNEDPNTKDTKAETA